MKAIEIPEPGRIRFGCNEVFDIGMVTPHRGHHRAPARSGRHDRPTHGIPDVHKRQWTRCVRCHAGNRGPFWADRREIVPDSATLLHRQRGFFKPFEDPAHAVRDRSHHEAVEKRDRPVRPCPRNNAPGWQESEILKGCVELVCPGRQVLQLWRRASKGGNEMKSEEEQQKWSTSDEQ